MDHDLGNDRTPATRRAIGIKPVSLGSGRANQAISVDRSMRTRHQSPAEPQTQSAQIALNLLTCLRARALGGALVLGWVTVAALALMNYITQWSEMAGVERFCTVLECVLLAAVVVLTIFYVPGPSDLDGSAN